MTYKCKFKMRCIDWVGDSFQCCLFYRFCKEYKKFEHEEHEQARQREIQRRKKLNCWEQMDDVIKPEPHGARHYGNE